MNIYDNKEDDLADILPPVRGRYTPDAQLGAVGWFRTGGTAEMLFKPADREDLMHFLSLCPSHVPVNVLGVLSNTIIRDGGLPGVTIRMGRDFAEVDASGHSGLVRVGAAALDGNVAAAAARAGIGGLEYLSGVPGTIGGALKMNAGAYGTETRDVLVEAEALDRQGQLHRLNADQMRMTYRHTDVPEDFIFIGATLLGEPGDGAEIEAHIRAIKERRAETQPIRSRTGGSTFANPLRAELEQAGLPPETRAWQLVEKAGGRGLRVGGAQMSELHCNFMINTGDATAADLENLGEEIRRRVYETSGIMLRWEIRRIGLHDMTSPLTPPYLQGTA